MRRDLTVLLAALLPLHAACASTAEPPRDGLYPELIEHPVPEDFSAFQQPESLRRDLERIQTGTLEERIGALKEKAIRDLVFVEGGTFLMGDFGPEHNVDGLPWSGEFHAMPLHEVTLDSFSISRYKVTLAEFDLYTEANGLPKAFNSPVDHERIGSAGAYRSRLDRPTGTSWQQARDYCGWLGEITGLPFGLPTEAQWEFAARNRGQFIVWATDNGSLEWNRNVPSHEFQSAWGYRSGLPHPIAHFPATPLGLHDLSRNGLEWINDRYGADYYSRQRDFHNPEGPSEGEERVQRSWPPGDSSAAMTMQRRHAPLRQTRRNWETGEQVESIGKSDTVRCAMHSEDAVEPEKTRR